MKTKFKVLKKAYRVWVYSHLTEVFCLDDIDVVYSASISGAKNQCDLYDAKNEDGDGAKWIDIKCKRVKEYDKVEYDGRIVNRSSAVCDIEEQKRQDKRKKQIMALSDEDMYYVQDARNYVGNSVLWWGLNSSGYACDIRKAQKYTKEELLKRFAKGRDSDVIWSAKHVEANISQHIDSQHLKEEFCI